MDNKNNNSFIQPQSQDNDSEDEEVITNLTLAGLKVLMVRKKDQIIYKLPDNMQVSSIGEEQRQQLMKEIQALHQATMVAAQQQQLKQQQQLIAPKNEILDTPPQPTLAEQDAIKETARKLREELEQQQQMMKQYNYDSSNPSSPHYDPNSKIPRRYNKTGKYSKKRQSNPSTPINISASSTPISANTPNPFSISDVPIQQQQPIIQQQQQQLMPVISGSNNNKRLPEEEMQHTTVKKRFVDDLISDQRLATDPDYKSPFSSLKDAMKRLLPYHIYQYPKNDLDANKIPLERQDHTMIEIFKCQSDLFEKHAKISKKLQDNPNLSFKVLLARQALNDSRQKLTEEQTRAANEQALQQQELLRVQTETARLQAIQDQNNNNNNMLQQQMMLQQQQQQQTVNYTNALFSNPEFVNQYNQLSPELQHKLMSNRDQLISFIEQQQRQQQQNNN